MSCCKKNTGYEFSIVLNEQSNIPDIEVTLKSIFSWNESKIHSIISIAKLTGKCKMFEVGQDEMVRLSKKLARNNIPYSVTQTKIQR